MVEHSNVNTNANYEAVFSSLKSDTVISATIIIVDLVEISIRKKYAW